MRIKNIALYVVAVLPGFKIVAQSEAVYFKVYFQ